MTVRVIKPAIREVSCHHCGSVLEYNPSDVQKTIQYDYLGDGELVRYITCPECTKDVKVHQ